MLLPILPLLSLGLQLNCASAQEPQWIAASVPPPAGQEVAFSRSFALPRAADKALVRVGAYDRYRLSLNGKSFTVGDTPWDAETYDVSGLLVAGDNTVLVAAEDDVSSPRNCWVWLRYTLPEPGSFSRLSFTTRNARANEWLYVEVVDADGNSSGFYCLERKRPDFVLGTGGAETDHAIDLLTEPRLQYRAPTTASGCDFSRIASVAVRVDQKDAFASPQGQVEFSRIKLSGEKEMDLTDAAKWSLEPGTGEWRRSSVSAAHDGAVRLQYDFTPAADPVLSFELRAWDGEEELVRVVSDASWAAAGAAVRMAESPMGVFTWTRTTVTGPDEPSSPPLRAGVMLDIGNGGRCEAGKPVAAEVRVYATEAIGETQVAVRAESWAGNEVFAAQADIGWE